MLKNGSTEDLKNIEKLGCCGLLVMITFWDALNNYINNLYTFKSIKNLLLLMDTERVF